MNQANHASFRFRPGLIKEVAKYKALPPKQQLKSKFDANKLIFGLEY